MAIFHMSFSNISAGKMRSAVASAAYRSGEYLFSDQEQKGYLYGRSILPEAFILVPENAPEWAKNRQRLWNEVEAVDHKANSRYAKEFNVALPVELSDEEQKQLLTTYVQKNFVDAGMVADVAIHRDHAGNPHAHVMLTNRPFNPDGTWGQKSKTEYILDDQGNKTYTKNGNLRQRKIWLVDWDKKEKITEWRHNWASAVNQVLEQKGLPDRISEKSYEEQGVNQQPTEHEGHTQFSHEKSDYNTTLKEKHRAQSVAQQAHQKGVAHRVFNALTENMSYREKHVVAQLGRELHTYVDLEHLDEKERLLQNWRQSVLLKHALGEDMTQQIVAIYAQKDALKNANALLDQIAQRAVKKLYPNLNQAALSVASQRELIKETNCEGRVFGAEEVLERIKDINFYLLERQVTTLIRRPYNSLRLLETQEERLNGELDRVLRFYGQSHKNLAQIAQGTLRQYREQDERVIYDGIKTLQQIGLEKRVITEQYDGVIGQVFPTAEPARLESHEKESLYNFILYYNPQLTPYEQTTITAMKAKMPPVFTTEEHQMGLAVLRGEVERASLKNAQLRRVLNHDGTKRLFLNESRGDRNLDQKLVDQAEQSFEKERKQADQLRKAQLPDYKAIRYRPFTPEQFAQTAFAEAVEAVLYETNRQEAQERQRRASLNQTERDMTKKQRQHTIRNEHEDPSSGLHM